MYKIQNLTSNAKQKQTLILPDGGKIFMSIEYVPLQLGWYIVELTYNDFTLKGHRICNSPNMLYQFRNQIPFGLACFSKAKREPTLKEDFLSDACEMFILTSDEVQEYTDYLSNG